MNNVAIQANSANNGAIEMKVDLFEGGDAIGRNGADLVEISKLFETQDAFFFRTEPFDRICLQCIIKGISSFNSDYLRNHPVVEQS